MVRPPVDPAAALAARAGRAPETPFLFFRDARGHFTWWSWARALRESVEPVDRGEGEAGAAAARAWLTAALAPVADDAARAAALLAELPAARGRDIWLTRGDLDRTCGRVMALAALGGGWAVVHEPAPSLHPATVLWARPTIVGGAVEELDELLAGCERARPRWRGARWLARRLARLRAFVVDSGDTAGGLVARLARLGSDARVLSIPRVEW